MTTKLANDRVDDYEFIIHNQDSTGHLPGLYLDVLQMRGQR